LPPCLCAPIHWHFSPLPFQETHLRPHSFVPPVDPPTHINDYYHLIYALYAYRGPSRPLRCLISAGGQLSAAFRHPYSRSNRARATEYDVEDRCRRAGSKTTTVYLESLRSIFGLFPRHLSRSADAIRTLLLALPRLFCGVASPRSLSLELICLLRVALSWTR